MLDIFTFEHIGWAVHSIEESLPIFQMLGFQHGEIISDYSQKVRVVFLEKSGYPRLELCEAIKKDDSLISDLLKLRGAARCCMCFM